MSKESLALWSKSEHAKIHGRLKSPMVLAIGRGYLWGYLNKPLEQLTDDDLLSVYGIGQKTLAQLRNIIPNPGT